MRSWLWFLLGGVGMTLALLSLRNESELAAEPAEQVCAQMRAMELEELRDWIGRQYIPGPVVAAILACAVKE